MCTDIKKLSACQSLWYNRSIRSKSKSHFFYQTWFDKHIFTIFDLFNPPFPGYKLFEELVLDFGIPTSDRRKFNFLIKSIPTEWLDNFDVDIVGVHETIVLKLVGTIKVPKTVYNVLLGCQVPDKRYTYWSTNVTVPLPVDWRKVHITNYFCTIDTKLGSFYFKIFHKAIALNTFLFKIKRKDSPNCSLCGKEEETMVHLFCDCEKVAPLWQGLLSTISQKDDSFSPAVTNFEKLFGICNDKFVTYLFLLLKYHVFTCKFNNGLPNFVPFKAFVIKNKETEYFLARKRNKLPAHFRKWRFDI